ncbi:hypothetical protein [Aneurinibacillus tyrosinisolvens]|uniref:hypothetical protein n=1 Tax=Aneurinibacillus tyrosinisolvens TaxID=1443435 RepID=UPI00063EF245|nr:hypothetical protein [Aneurinibacillus tyrosinisolvens]
MIFEWIGGSSIWPLVSLLGFVGMIVFGLLATIAALRKKRTATYFKYAILCFAMLLASLLFYKP